MKGTIGDGGSMSHDDERERYAKMVLKLTVWERKTITRNAALHEGVPMSTFTIERGLLQLERMNFATRDGDNYTITDAGRTAREALLAK